MLEKEEENARTLANRAIECIYDGKLTEAKKIVVKLKRLYPITECLRMITLVQAMILITKKKRRKAKQLILSNNYGTWGSSELKSALRLCNPRVDKDTKTFQMTLKGGCATFGIFTTFTEEHECDLVMLANNESEAFSYACELCRFIEPEKVEILYVEESVNVSEETHRGVFYNSTFRVHEDVRLSA